MSTHYDAAHAPLVICSGEVLVHIKGKVYKSVLRRSISNNKKNGEQPKCLLRNEIGTIYTATRMKELEP